MTLEKYEGAALFVCRKFTPSVIEPSFGIGRIIYCMFEHAYYARESNEDKSVFRCAAHSSI